MISMIYAYCENCPRVHKGPIGEIPFISPPYDSLITEPHLSRETRERSRSRDTIAKTVPFPDRQLRPIMTRAEILQRLQTIKDKGTSPIGPLESKPLSVDTQAEIRSLAHWIKEELHSEYNRMLPKRAQRTMSVFELSVYSPTIEETWKKSGISRLKIDGTLDQKWQEPLESVIYNAGKYLS